MFAKAKELYARFSSYMSDKPWLYPIIVGSLVAVVIAITGGLAGAGILSVGVFAAAMPTLAALVTTVTTSVAAQTAILAGIGFVAAGMLSGMAIATVKLFNYEDVHKAVHFDMKNSAFVTAPAWLSVIGFALVGLPMVGLLPTLGAGPAMAAVAAALTGGAITVATAGAPLIGMAIITGIMALTSLVVYGVMKLMPAISGGGGNYKKLEEDARKDFNTVDLIEGDKTWLTRDPRASLDLHTLPSGGTESSYDCNIKERDGGIKGAPLTQVNLP